MDTRTASGWFNFCNRMIDHRQPRERCGRWAFMKPTNGRLVRFEPNREDRHECRAPAVATYVQEGTEENEE